MDRLSCRRAGYHDEKLGLAIIEYISDRKFVFTNDAEPGILFWEANAPEQIGAEIKRLTGIK